MGECFYCASRTCRCDDMSDNKKPTLGDFEDFVGSTTGGGQRGYGIGEVVLYGCPPDRPWLPKLIPETIPGISPETLPKPDIFKPLLLKEEADLRFREIMDELRTLRQALDSAKATIIVEIRAELRAGTRVTDAPKKPTLRTSHRGKGKKHDRKVQARRKR